MVIPATSNALDVRAYDSHTIALTAQTISTNITLQILGSIDAVNYAFLKGVILSSKTTTLNTFNDMPLENIQVIITSQNPHTVTVAVDVTYFGK